VAVEALLPAARAKGGAAGRCPGALRRCTAAPLCRCTAARPPARPGPAAPVVGAHGLRPSTLLTMALLTMALLTYYDRCTRTTTFSSRRTQRRSGASDRTHRTAWPPSTSRASPIGGPLPHPCPTRAPPLPHPCPTVASPAPPTLASPGPRRTSRPTALPHCLTPLPYPTVPPAGRGPKPRSPPPSGAQRPCSTQPRSMQGYSRSGAPLRPRPFCRSGSSSRCEARDYLVTPVRVTWLSPLPAGAARAHDERQARHTHTHTTQADTPP
jgi:hypothetical protein